MKNKKAIVIGSGIAGLTTAIRLQKMGLDTVVFEKNKAPGGKIAERRFEEFRFDIGPSVFTKPELFCELLGGNLEDHFDIIDQPFRYFFQDQTFIDLYCEYEALKKEIETKLPGEFERLEKYLKNAKDKHDITFPVFMTQTLHKARSFMNKETLKGILNFGKIDAFTTLHEVNKKYLNAEKLIQIFDNYAHYVGSHPYKTPGTYSLIAHLEINDGLYWPKGGMRNIINKLYEKAKSLGTTFHFQQTVDKILYANKAVDGVLVNDQEYLADFVISNMDVDFTYSKLLNQKLKDKYRTEKSSSAVTFHWSMKGSFPELMTHNMFFPKQSKTDFDNVFDKNIAVSEDPTVYIFNSCKIDPNDAPEDGENWMVVVFSDYDKGQNWDEITNKARELALKKIEKQLALKDLKSRILNETTLTPKKIENNYLANKGSIYGDAMHGSMSVFKRHPNFHPKIKGLYFAGGTVHPGAGLPMCMLSAKIVAKLIGKKIS